MNNQTIFGKDINTNAIIPLPVLGNVLLTTNGDLDNLNDVVITSPATNQLLQYNGTNWVNYTPPAKEYIVLNLIGTTTSTLTSTNTFKSIFSTTAGYYSNSPNPNTGTFGSVSSNIASVYDNTTGFITLNSSKNYVATATINQGGINLSAATVIELAIYNASSGTAVQFSPNFYNSNRMDIDFTGGTVSVTAYITGASKIAVMFRYVVGQNIAVNALDTGVCLSVIEV